MEQVRLLCRTIGPELTKLQQILIDNNIEYEVGLKDISCPDADNFCIYDVYVKSEDLEQAGKLLSKTGYAVWVKK